MSFDERYRSEGYCETNLQPHLNSRHVQAGSRNRTSVVGFENYLQFCSTIFLCLLCLEVVASKGCDALRICALQTVFNRNVLFVNARFLCVPYRDVVMTSVVSIPISKIKNLLFKAILTRFIPQFFMCYYYYGPILMYKWNDCFIKVLDKILLNVFYDQV